MDKINVSIRNCYGIKRLDYEFDFSSESAYALYAPNGVMKSSLARVFSDIAEERKSGDRIFENRDPVRTITDENGNELDPECILVVPPYDPDLNKDEEVALLLVDAKLRKESERLGQGIKKAEESLLKALREQANCRKDLRSEIPNAFIPGGGDLRTALMRIESELKEQDDAPFADIEYDKIFEEKALAFITEESVRSAIKSYVERYNQLLAASTYFKRGTFEYYNASTIAKTLASNGFFEARHTVRLNADEPVEIKTRKELEDVITKEKGAILADAELKAAFNAFEKLMDKNAPLRSFRNYLMDHEDIISKLANPDGFKQELWKSYLTKHFDLYSNVISEYHAASEREKKIRDEAAKQRTQWEEVIRIFNSRFMVPFKLSVKNMIEVQLGNESIATLEFTYHDGDEAIPVTKGTLLDRLSTGERKAFYILNIVFDVEVRRHSKRETIMIIDDLADSFDYQNKYAIIQYLKDINDNRLFKQIIMTHNFDFFRTINLRQLVGYSHCLMAGREPSRIELRRAVGIRNVFLKDWKEHFFDDPKKRIASIAFIRNLAEYTKGEDDQVFIKMTSLLHWKADSTSITVADLDATYDQVFDTKHQSKNGSQPVVDLIQEQASECRNADVGANFENKIVLAIAIRLAAEKFMVSTLNDAEFVGSIKSNQTQVLVARFKELFPGSPETDVLDRVVLMTPENIHLNSFMYEPLIDMSDNHLRQLYDDVIALNDLAQEKWTS